MRGASYLAGLDLKSKEGLSKSMIVVDIGGTTTDIGMLLPSGFPRQAAAFIESKTLATKNESSVTYCFLSSRGCADKVNLDSTYRLSFF